MICSARKTVFSVVLALSLFLVTPPLSAVAGEVLGTATNTIPIGNPIGALNNTPIVAYTGKNGLEATLRITPGPYFLSELLYVSVTFTNHSKQAVMLANDEDLNSVCRTSGTLDVTITEGKEYRFPTYDYILPPCMGNFAKPIRINQSITAHGYIWLTKSGTVTIKASADFFKNENNYIVKADSPLDGHWPSITVHVAPQIPSDRVLSLKALGDKITVSAPDTANHTYVYATDCEPNPVAFQSAALQDSTCTYTFPSDHKKMYSISTEGYAISTILMTTKPKNK